MHHEFNLLTAGWAFANKDGLERRIKLAEQYKEKNLLTFDEQDTLDVMKQALQEAKQ